MEFEPDYTLELEKIAAVQSAENILAAERERFGKVTVVDEKKQVSVAHEYGIRNRLWTGFCLTVGVATIIAALNAIHKEDKLNETYQTPTPITRDVYHINRTLPGSEVIVDLSKRIPSPSPTPVETPQVHP